MTHQEAKDLTLDIASLLNDRKAIDIKVLDVYDITPLYDFIIIASGQSQVYLRSIAHYIEINLKDLGLRKLSPIKNTDSSWIIIDLGFIVVHLFLEDTREFYNIEQLWGGASILEGSFVL